MRGIRRSDVSLTNIYSQIQESHYIGFENKTCAFTNYGIKSNRQKAKQHMPEPASELVDTRTVASSRVVHHRWLREQDVHTPHSWNASLERFRVPHWITQCHLHCVGQSSSNTGICDTPVD